MRSVSNIQNMHTLCLFLIGFTKLGFGLSHGPGNQKHLLLNVEVDRILQSSGQCHNGDLQFREVQEGQEVNDSILLFFLLVENPAALS